MPKIIKNGKEYSGVPIEVVTAWAPTADPVQVKEPLMGNTDISTIGDGTVTGAIDELNTDLTAVESGLISLTAVEVPISNVLTIASGISITNSYCYKFGKLVHIKMLLARESSTSHDSAIGTFKSGFVPTGTSYSVAMGYATGADAGVAGMVTTGSGGISIQHLPNKPYVVINTSYLVAE